MPMPTDVFGIAELGLGLYGIHEQTQRADKQREEENKRRQEALDYQDKVRDRIIPAISGVAKEQTRGYEARTSALMADLEGAGRQEKKDIGERFRKSRKRTSTNINRRLGGGAVTVGASMEAASYDEESDAIGGAEERIRGQRLATRAMATGEELQAKGYYGMLPANYEMDLGQQRLGLINQKPPGPGTSPALAYSQFLGQYAKGPEAPEEPGTDWAALGISSATTVGTAAMFMSDPRVKCNVREANQDEVLRKLELLRVPHWEYVGDGPGDGTHLGPMADQFKQLFNLGNSATTINVIDALGVCMASIKALSSKVKDLETELDYARSVRS